MPYVVLAVPSGREYLKNKVIGRASDVMAWLRQRVRTSRLFSKIIRS